MKVRHRRVSAEPEFDAVPRKKTVEIVVWRQNPLCPVHNQKRVADLQVSSNFLRFFLCLDLYHEINNVKFCIT